MTDALLNALKQLFYFVGSVFIVGFIIAQLSKAFYRMFASKTLCYVLGVIGTPIHELSHAIMCIIFGHKIVEMKLFQVDENDSKLGYVNHSYNPKNIYHQIGNYFIGVAPILVGTLIICVLMYFMLPDTFSVVSSYIDSIVKTTDNGFSLSIFVSAFKVVISLFSNVSVGLMWILFIIIAACISMHMSLSGADIKGSVKAIPIIAIILAAVNILLSFISDSVYTPFVNAMDTIGAYLIAILILSLIFSIIVVLLASIVKIILRIFIR